MKPTRRDFLRAGGTAAVASVAGASIGAAQPSFDGWLSDANNYDEIVDQTGQESVAIEVGAGSAGLAFGPAAVRIDPGTTVTWEWTGQGGSHNVSAQEGAGFQSELVSEEGHTFEQTLDEAGIITYQCDPHAGAGMRGALVVGDVEVGGGSEGFVLPGGGFGRTFLVATFGIVGGAAALVLGGEYGPAVARRVRGERRPSEVDLTPEQRERLENGETVEVVTEDGDHVTIRPRE